VKNKKLFAILTLVCFMFTLMPVAAFAAVDPAPYAVKVQDGANYVEDVYVTAGVPFAVGAVTTSDTLLTTAAAYYVVDANGNGVQIAYAAASTTAGFTIKLPGTYTVYAAIDETGDLATLVANANSLLHDETAATAVAKIQKLLDAQIIKTAAYVTVEAPDSNFVIKVDNTTGSQISVGPKADSGFSAAGNAQVVIQLLNNGQPVVGKVPTIVAPEYVTVVPVNANKVVTDAAGKITYNISANRAGDFKVVFSYADAVDETVTVNAWDTNVANVEVVKESANAINNDARTAGVNTGAVVKFTDANGKALAITGTSTPGSLVAGQVKVTVVSQPTGSKLDASDFELVASTTYPGASELKTTTQGALLKVGSYEVKMALANGKSVTVGFDAAKMGNVVGIRFVQPMATVALGTTVSAVNFTVQAYDANGVVDTLAYPSEYTLSAQGKALVANGGGVFGVSTEDKFIGSTITVLAKDINNKFVATTTVEVVDNGAEVVYVNTTAEVGVTTTLKANVLDVKGNKVAISGTPTFVVLDKPANAYAYVGIPTVGAKDFTVDFLGSVAGEYKIQTVIVDGNNEFVTGITTITVGANEAAFKDVIVMSIGANQLVKNDEVVAMPAAPEIVDSRTMVPARAGLEAFGAVVVWDEATRTVTAELGGVKVVMEIGEKVYTVNGVEKVGDAAPYITAASTMVPVSFFTNAFGITATPIYDDYGVCDVLFTK